jgi:hypothetical protein
MIMQPCKQKHHHTSPRMYILIEFGGGKGWWREVDFSTGEGVATNKRLM